MKITILYDAWEGTEDYPGANTEREGGGSRRRPKLDREEIDAALKGLGHETETFGVDGTHANLAALARLDADLLFNLVESFGGDDTKEMHVAAFLELLGKRFTGSGAAGLLLAQDKVVAKKIIRFHDLYTPYFAVVHRGRVDDASHDIRFPVVVKPSSEDGSKGIDSGSVVRSIKELMERIEYIQTEFDSPALLEEYVEGREIYAAVLGNGTPEALPLVELDLSALPEGSRVAGYEVKFDRSSDAYRKTKSAIAEDLDEATVEKIQGAAVSAYQALKLRDYGRVDIRLTPEGQVYIIEVNPNPWLTSSAEFAMAAKASGRSYRKLIEEIVESANQR